MADINITFSDYVNGAQSQWGQVGGSIYNQLDLIAILNSKQSVLNYVPENVANKAVAGGYASLDGTGKVPVGQLPSLTTAIWGSITGLLSNQSDLSTALAAKQGILPSGSSSQYLRGDLTMQTLNSDAVPEGSTNLYFTTSRARNVLLATAPLSYNSGTGTISIPFASASQDGYLKQGDFASFEKTSNKGAANGYASLDGSGKIPSSQLPAVAVNNTYVVSSQSAMLALSADVGDVAVRTDINQTFILQSLPASTLGNWVEFLVNQSPVTSVNSLTGAVTLTTTNIAEGSNQYFTNTRAQSAISVSGGYLTYASGVVGTSYTPVNKSGDTMSGPLTITGSGVLLTVGNGGANNDGIILVNGRAQFGYDGTYHAIKIFDNGNNKPLYVTLSGQDRYLFENGSTTFHLLLSQPTSQTAVAASGGSLPGATYYFKVSALDVNNQETGQYTEVSAVVDGVTNTKVNLTWAASAGAVNYRVYYGTAAGAEANYFAVGNVTSYSFTTTTGSTAGSPNTSPQASAVLLTANGPSWINGGNFGLRQTSPSSYLHIGAGGSSAGSSPLKLTTSGATGLATVEDGAIEYFSNHIWVTIGATRYQLDQQGGGGFTSPMTTLGDILYENATPAAARLPGNITTTKEYLSQTGNGTISAAPAWAQIQERDIQKSIRSVTANFTFNSYDETVEIRGASAAVTGTLPLLSSVAVGTIITLCIGNGTWGGTITAAGSDKISNQTSWSMPATVGSSISVQANATQWDLIY